MDLRQTGAVFRGVKVGVAKSRCKFHALAVCAALMTFATTGWGQLTLPAGTSYTETFNSIGTALPTGWTVRTGATSSARGTSQAFANTSNTWADTGGSFKNLASANGGSSSDTTATQNARTDRALGIRQTGTFANPGGSFELELASTTGKTGFGLSIKHQMLSVQARSTTWTVQYSTTGTSWTNLGTYTDPGIWGSTTGSYSFGTAIDNLSGPVYIRVVALTASTGGSSNDTYAVDDFVLSWANASASTPPTLSAAGSATVDGEFNVTFTENAAWRQAITGVTVNGTALTAGWSALTSGQITFTPSASSPANLLQASGSKTIVVSATGYNTTQVIQSIGVGVANKLAVTTQPTAPASNGGAPATSPVVRVQDRYGNTVTSSSASITAAKGDAGTWTLGGTTSVNASSGVATFSGLTATSATAVTEAAITFSSGSLTPAPSSSFSIPAPELGRYSAGSTSASGTAASISLGTLARGPGVSSTSATGYYVSSTWDSATRVAARTANEFHGFAATPSANYTGTYSSFTFTAYRTASGPTVVGVGYSTDGGTTWTDSDNYSVAADSTDYTFTWDFTDFTTASEVIFRVYGWSASSTGNLRTKDFILRGSVARIVTAPLLGSPTVTVSSISTTSATLGATITDDGGDTITSRGTVWGTTANPTGNSLAEGGTSVAAFSHSRTSLTANTAYFYRGYAVNATGTGYSADGTFTTLPLPPTVGTGSAANTTGFTANWSPPSMGSAAYTYTVQVDDDSNFGSVNATQSSISSASTSQAISGLVSGTTYFYRVRASNAQGDSAWSSTSAGIATTVPSTPTITAGTAGALSSFTGSPSSSTSVAVTGTALSTAISVSAPAGFEVSSNDSSWNTTATLASGGGTLYIRIAANAPPGSPSGNVVLSSTGASNVNVGVAGTVYTANPIAHVTGFSSGTITTANIPLSWTAASPQPDGYLILVSSTSVTDPVDGIAVSDSTSVSGGTGAVNLAGNATSYSGFTGFAAGTLYTFKIYPYNNSGGNIRYLTTGAPTLSSQELLPAAPSAAPTFSAVSASGFTVTWNAVTGADDYRLDISTVSNFATFVSGYENLTVSGTSRVVTGLEGGTTYHVRVRAANLAGSSVSSAAANQNTLPTNDLAASPTAVTVNGGTVSGTTAGATVSTPFTDTFPDVWFSFTAPANGTVTLTTTSSTAQDLDISGWENAAPTTVTTGDRVANGKDGGDQTEVATLAVTSGTTYFIRVFRYSGTAGSFTLGVTMPLAAPVTLAASGVSSSGFTANWNAVAGSTGYRVDVYSGGSTSTVFETGFTGFTGTGFTPSPIAGQLDSDTWIIRGMSADTAPAFGATLTSTSFGRGSSSGGVSNAGIYAFTVATGNTALGVQPTSADFTPGDIVLRIQNTTGSPINNLTVSYKIYVLNNEGRANSFNFSHSADDTTYTGVADLDYTSQAAASATPTWVAVTRSATLTGLSIANNSFYYLRWTSDDVSGTGNRDEFALDDVSVTTSTATYLYTNADAGSATSFAVTGAAATTAYSYVVRAVSATETSVNSDVRAVTTKGTSSIAVNSGTTSLTYSGSAQGPTFTVTGSAGALSYSYAGTGATTYGPTATAPTNVGTYTVTATAAADANFDGASSAATAFTIQAASLPTVTFTAPASLIYNRTAMTYQASATGPSGLTLTYTGRNSTTYNSATAPTNVGDYTVTATTSDTNYTGSRAENFSIAAKGITGTFTASNKGYDGSDSASVTGRSLSGVETGDTVTLEGGTATFANALVGNAKTVTLAGASLAGTAASNYTLGSVSTTTANITAALLASGDITLNSNGDGSYTASAAGGAATFSYSYAGRSANGITTSYSSATAPTVAGYYTVSATATGNYSGSNTADYFVAGPVAVDDPTRTKSAGNTAQLIPISELLANDRRITSTGTVESTGLTVTGVTNGSGNTATLAGAFIQFTPSSAATDTFTYTVTYEGKTATATVTVTTETEAPAFPLQIVKVGTAAFAGGNTTVTHDFIGVPNQTYLVEYKGDLAEASWTSAGAQSTGSTGSFSVTFTKAGDHTTDWNGSMFFQARRQ